jgi:hypothetical protein
MDMWIEDSQHMANHLPIPFPTEPSELRKQLAAERQWTLAQRLLAVVDALAAAEALSQAGTVREAQLKYHEDLEEEWRRRMKEFIKRHALP